MTRIFNKTFSFISLFSLLLTSLFLTTLLFIEPSFAASNTAQEQRASQNEPINLLDAFEAQTQENSNLEEDILSEEQIGGTEEVDAFESLYKVELLVFAYVNTGEENSEIWRNPSRPSFEIFQPNYEEALSEQALENKSESSLINNAKVETTAKKNTYVFLNPEEKGVSELKDIMRKMKINGHFRILKHMIWQQKVLEESAQDLFYLTGGEKYLNYDEALTLEVQKNSAPVVKINNVNNEKSLQAGQFELEGTLHIYRSRYLHIKSNLWLSEYAENDAGLCLENGTVTEFSHLQTLSSPLLTHEHIKSYTALTNFRLNQHRRMRSSELHYLDHPRFGLLIKFSRVEKPTVEKQ